MWSGLSWGRNNIFGLRRMPYVKEDDLEVGKSYTMIFIHTVGPEKGKEYKEFFGKYKGIDEVDETTGYAGMSTHSTGRKLKRRMFERPHSKGGSKGFKISHFTEYGIKIEEGDTTKHKGGRRRTHRKRKNKRKTRR